MLSDLTTTFEKISRHTSFWYRYQKRIKKYGTDTRFINVFLYGIASISL